MKHVDRLLSLGRDQHEVDIAAVSRDGAAHAVQQAEGVLRYVWHGRFGDMLIEVKDGVVLVNGEVVIASTGDAT